MKTSNSTHSNNRHLPIPVFLKHYLSTFTEMLAKQGFTILTIRGYSDAVIHFGTWLLKQNKSIDAININCVHDFAKHHCNCHSRCRKKNLSHKYVKRVLKFVNFLSKQKIIEWEPISSKTMLPPILEKFSEHLSQRGLSPMTIKSYEYSVAELITELGSNIEKYDSQLIQQVICNVTQHLSRCVAKKLTVALRAYLRFLSLEGLCAPDLDKTVPIIAQWKLSSMPRYITSNDVESVINSCDIHTHQGVRDRAIILLLARLGLRAGDIVNMYIDDINWAEGCLTVRGKSQNESLLPLPQETGNAILVYLKQVRPSVPLKQLFLCLNAPHRAFSTSTCVSNIARSALLRSGIVNLPSHGAHLLRHSAATSLLRDGATLETVSSLLRHNSLDMTAYYAKVDIPNLMKITQPWPEGISC